MRRRNKNQQKIISDMNVVPYIDVMLVLLIIFMVTAPMMTQGIKIELPTATSENIDIDTDNLPIVLSINIDGKYFIEETGNSKESNIESIVDYINLIRKDKPNIKVLIRGDEKSEYGNIVKLMDSLKQNNINDFGLITKN